jgi:UPF0755 protein
MLRTKKEKLKAFLLVLSILVIAFAVFFFWLQNQSSPVDNANEKEIYLEVKKGDKFYELLVTLQKDKLIRSPLAAKFYWWFNDYELKVGYYRISSRMSLPEMLSALHKAKEFLIKLTIPEGLTYLEIADLLKKHPDFGQIAQDFRNACTNSKLLAKYKIPFPSADGYLFPSTYLVSKKISGEELAVKMITTFFKKAGDSFQQLELEKKKQVLIMATIN